MNNKQKQAGIWVLVGVFFLIAIFLYLTRRVVTPFFIAFGLAYLLDPLVDKLQERKLGRTTATVLLLASFFGALILSCALLMPVMQIQVEKLTQNLPDYIGAVQGWVNPIVEKVSSIDSERAREIIQDSLKKLGNIPMKVFSSATSILWESFSGVLNILIMAVNLIIIPVAMFYLLRDFDLIVAKVFELVPPKNRDQIKEITLEINEVLSKFVRGQLMVASLMAGLYSLGLFIIGTPLSLFIGVLAGYANLIPYAGAVFGFVPAFILTLLHHQELEPLLGVAFVFGAVQALEGMIITPRVVGEQIGLHPVVIMIAVLIGVEFFGLLGAILGVPVAAVAQVLIKRGIIRYRESSFYS
jgi:predicted PurR-regulated permease PerM